jgi:hypothetical protein
LLDVQFSLDLEVRRLARIHADTTLQGRRGYVDPDSPRDGHGRVANVLGATIGGAALGLGAARMRYRDAPPGLAVANVIAGAASTWASS